MGNGFIMLPRSCAKWSFRNDHNTFSVAIHLLMMASYTPTEWNGIKIDRGQCVTSFNKLAQRCNLTVKQIRGILTKLEGQSFLTRKGTKLYSIITICNYDSYQGLESEEGQSKGQSERATKNKLYNKINQEKKVIINDKDVFSEKSKKTSFNDSFSLFIENIKHLCPTISDCMEMPDIKQYIALRENYTDNQLLSIIMDIDGLKTWHSYNNLYAAMKQYLANKDVLPNYEDEIP